MSRDKILDRDDLLARAAEARRLGQTIAFTHGCFDILCVGHIRYLQRARTLGEILIVAIDSDRSVRALEGRSRPLVPAHERAEVVAAIEGVTWVTVCDELDISVLMRQIRPAIHVKATDHRAEEVRERAIVSEWGGALVLVGDSDARDSTADLIRRLVRAADEAELAEPDDPLSENWEEDTQPDGRFDREPW